MLAWNTNSAEHSSVILGVSKTVGFPTWRFVLGTGFAATVALARALAVDLEAALGPAFTAGLRPLVAGFLTFSVASRVIDETRLASASTEVENVSRVLMYDGELRSLRSFSMQSYDCISCSY